MLDLHFFTCPDCQGDEIHEGFNEGLIACRSCGNSGVIEVEIADKGDCHEH